MVAVTSLSVSVSETVADLKGETGDDISSIGVDTVAVKFIGCVMVAVATGEDGETV